MVGTRELDSLQWQQWGAYRVGCFPFLKENVVLFLLIEKEQGLDPG